MLVKAYAFSIHHCNKMAISTTDQTIEYIVLIVLTNDKK